MDGAKPGNRIHSWLQDDLAGQSADNRGARSNDGPTESGNRRVPGQHDDGPATNLRQFTPPHIAPIRKLRHEALAALRQESRSPHSSG